MWSAKQAIKGLRRLVGYREPGENLRYTEDEVPPMRGFDPFGQDKSKILAILRDHPLGMQKTTLQVMTGFLPEKMDRVLRDLYLRNDITMTELDGKIIYRVQ